jgi:hypothetical protein
MDFAADDDGNGPRSKQKVTSVPQQYITPIHACIRIAVPFALISSYGTQFELKQALTPSKVTCLFVDAMFLKSVLPSLRRSASPRIGST